MTAEYHNLDALSHGEKLVLKLMRDGHDLHVVTYDGGFVSANIHETTVLKSSFKKLTDSCLIELKETVFGGNCEVWNVSPRYMSLEKSGHGRGET